MLNIGAYINQDPIGLDGGLNLSAYVANPLKGIDPLGLKGDDDTLLAEMETKVAANNNSGQSNNLILCMAWKESSFDSSATTSNTSATGLMQMTKKAVKQVNKLKTYGTFKHDTDMLDADKSLQAGSAYLKWTIQWKGDLTSGLNAYKGDGSDYATDVKNCSDCLDNCAKNGLTCSNKTKWDCLHGIHK